MPTHTSPSKRPLSSPAPSPARSKARRFNTPAAVLDHTAYPHIFDKVLAVSTWPSLLMFRTVCRDLCDRIDARLFSHVTLRRQTPDYKEERWSIDDRYIPSRVELRDADGHRLPGVRWEDDVPWAERVDAAFRMRRFTRTLDVVNELSLDNQIALPEAELRSLPDERRAVVRAHDGNLLRVALSALDGMRLFDVSQICSLPVKTSVQYSALEMTWNDIDQFEPYARICAAHTEPLDKLVVVLQWDPALDLLDMSSVKFNEEIFLSNSFYRHRHRQCQPREIVVVLRHDTRHMPAGRQINNCQSPYIEPREYGMLCSVVRWVGEKVGMVNKITVVGLDTVLPHINRTERGEELHDAIRQYAKVHWERNWPDIDGMAAAMTCYYNDDLHVGQLQSHPEFHRIAMAEEAYFEPDDGFHRIAMTEEADFDSDDDLDSGDEDMGEVLPLSWTVGHGPSVNPYLGDSSASIENVGHIGYNNDDDDYNGGSDHGDYVDRGSNWDSDSDFALKKTNEGRKVRHAAQVQYMRIAALRAEPVDTALLSLTLDEWYLMGDYSRKHLPCTESQLDPEELAALSIQINPLPVMVAGPVAGIEFMTHKEYEEAVGRETYKWEMDGYEWEAHETCACKTCARNAAPLE